MSEENKDLGDKAEDAFENAKETAGDAIDSAKETAGEVYEDAKEAASDFADSAKETAEDFKDGIKDAFDTDSGENKKMLAGILGILLGTFGVHKFILGYTKEGVIMLILGLLGFVTCGITSMVSGIVGLIEGIMYLTKSDGEFYNTYQAGQKPWF